MTPPEQMDGVPIRPRCNKPDCEGFHPRTRNKPCWFAAPHGGMTKSYPDSIQEQLKTELPSRRPNPYRRVPKLSPNRNKKPKFPDTAPARGSSRLRSPVSKPRSSAKASHRSRTRSPPVHSRPDGSKLFRDPAPAPEPTRAAIPTAPDQTAVTPTETGPTDPMCTTPAPPPTLTETTLIPNNVAEPHGSTAMMQVDAGNGLPEGTLRCCLPRVLFNPFCIVIIVVSQRN